MTCVIGIVQDGRVYLGADSCGSNSWSKTNRLDPKVFRNGEFVFGFTSSYRMGQLIRYSFNPPPITENKDLFAYMVTDFVEALRTALKSGGFTKIENSVERGGEFLVGVRGRLFKIETDFQVGESADGYDACGCGEAYALGVLNVTMAGFQSKGDVDIRLTLALEAASHHSAGVAPPFHFVSTE